MNNNRIILATFIISTTVFLGCIGGGSQPKQPTTRVTPCDIITKGVQLTFRASALTADEVKPRLAPYFVDDFQSPASQDIKESYEMQCRWGRKEGEKREHYYCFGKYRAPALNDEGVIQFYVWKHYKIGFEVEKQEIGVWVDSKGKEHRQDAFYTLIVKEVLESCFRA
ncbi:MAG: hypothetical protein GF334_04600 [Candidatus Altiarchaeales archaeon]|nr:hypothetical protein [Candidatus Altiarchaeales archaeon]